MARLTGRDRREARALDFRRARVTLRTRQLQRRVLLMVELAPARRRYGSEYATNESE
jgi:hypothetical protein